MTFDMFSRLASSRADRSFYQQLREDEDDLLDSTADAENARRHLLEDVDLERLESVLDGPGSETIPQLPHEPPRSDITPSDLTSTMWTPHDQDLDEEVPASLLVEAQEPRTATVDSKVGSTTKPRSDAARRQTQQHIRFDTRPNPHHVAATAPARPNSRPDAVSPRDIALWHWVNTVNLDLFVDQVYQYYRGSGLWCIICSRALHLCEAIFMAVLVTFIFQCVDYSKLHGSHTLPDILIPQCTTKMSRAWGAGIWAFTFYFLWKCVQFALDLRRLLRIHAFCTHLLNIPEHDMQTVSWQDIVARIMLIRDANPQTATTVMAPNVRRFIGSQSKTRLDAHDIANRLMRKENYFIAMINKDVFDFSLPVPFLRGWLFFSPTLEWLIQFSILDFVFSYNGQVRQEFLRADRRRVLSQKLRQRFVFAGLLNLVCAPFVMAYMILRWVSEYYQEYQKDPSVFGARRYTPLAQWKFREFNELDHLFQERIKMSYPFAHRYVTQFPKQLTEQIARTVMFIAGALIAAMAALTIHDAEFLNFEITPDRTALFYLTVLGGIWAAARGNVSEDMDVFSPEYALKNVIEYTRYVPEHWQDRLHGAEVLREFSELYKPKWLVLFEELLGAITAPCVMLFSMPKRAEQIIDFFREFTIHVDGLGYVCSFAVFDFKQGTMNHQQAVDDVREGYYSSMHGKLAASFYGFMDNYVMNPKTGIPGHIPPALNNRTVHGRFQPPPEFPALDSSAMAAAAAADGPAGRFGRHGVREYDDAAGRQRSRRSGIYGPSMTGTRYHLASPMASILLDPRHQPSAESQSVYMSRHLAGFSAPRQRLPTDAARTRMGEDADDESDAGGMLGESIWETSPAQAS